MATLPNIMSIEPLARILSTRLVLIRVRSTEDRLG